MRREIGTGAGAKADAEEKAGCAGARGADQATGACGVQAAGQAGLTLLEMTLALLLAGSVVVGLGFVAGYGFDAYRTGQVFAAMQRDGTALMEFFAAAARRADSVGLEPGSVQFRFPRRPDGREEPPLSIAATEEGGVQVTVGEKAWVFSDTAITLASLPRVTPRFDAETGSRLIEVDFVLASTRDSLPFRTTVLQRNFGVVAAAAETDGEAVR